MVAVFVRKVLSEKAYVSCKRANEAGVILRRLLHLLRTSRPRRPWDPHARPGTTRRARAAKTFREGCAPSTASRKLGALAGFASSLACRANLAGARATRPAQRGRGRTEQEVKEMETTKIPLSQCVESKLQNRAIPTCIPDLPEHALKSDYEPWSTTRMICSGSFP